MSTPKQDTRSSAKELFEWVARYIWPFVVMWNVYLFQCNLNTDKALQDYKLHVAQNYTSKQDLEKMMTGLENRLGKRLDLVLQLFSKERK